MLPFTPTNKNNMIAWLSAKCDLDDYGALKVFKFPKERTIFGPMQIESRIDQDTEISQKLTLWGQVGSRVIRGHMMVIPFEGNLLYAEPIYLQATQSKLPELKRVILAYNNQIVMEKSLDDAISVITGDSGFKSNSPEKETSDKTLKAMVATLVNEYKQFKSSTKKLDWAAFAKSMKKIDTAIEKLKTYQKTHKKESY
jgi:uncharacterized membrane protein (UPF0182 family)